MVAKHQRQQVIRELVEAGGIRNQPELQRALRRKSIDVDQSTLSRDLQELGIRKHGAHYHRDSGENGQATTRADYAHVVHRFVTCGPHLIVLHTAIGQAQPVAIAIDHAGDPSVEGTVAGDDTILIATRSRRQQTVALRRLQEWFGDKKT